MDNPVKGLFKSVVAIAFAACAFGMLDYPASLAEVPQLIAYQGKLTEANGVSLSGEHVLIFRLYNSQEKGRKLWEEVHKLNIPLQDNGMFSIVLGSLVPFGDLDFNQPLWISLQVDEEEEMSPRVRLTSVSYAINADTLDGLDSSQFIRSDSKQQKVKARVYSKDPLSLNAGEEVPLFSATIATSDPSSKILVLYSLELNIPSQDETKIEVSIFADDAPVDVPNKLYFGAGNRVISLPLTFHSIYDAPAGEHTLRLKIKSDKEGVVVNSRRISAVEIF